MTIYKYRKSAKDPTDTEYRIHLLYQLLEKGIMPWMWDTENYMDENKDMYGYFYPQDLNAILQVRQLESEYKEPKK